MDKFDKKEKDLDYYDAKLVLQRQKYNEILEEYEELEKEFLKDSTNVKADKTKLQPFVNFLLHLMMDLEDLKKKHNEFWQKMQGNEDIWP